MFIRTAVNCKVSESKERLLLDWTAAHANEKGLRKMLSTIGENQVSESVGAIEKTPEQNKIDNDWQHMIEIFGGS